MIHNVDFSQSVNTIYSYAFSFSGLTNVDFPNAVSGGVASRVFSSSTVVSCSLTSFNLIGSSMFANCTYLGNVYMPNATEIYDNAFSKCERLNKLDVTNVKTLYAQALANCYIDTFFAPNCTQIICDDNVGLGENCSVRVLYLPNFESVDENTFSNTSLNKLEILWLPKAEITATATIDAPSLKLLYATNTSSLSLSNVKNASVVISNKMESFDTDTLDTLDNLVFIIPDNSNSSFKEQTENENILFVDTNDVKFIGFYDNDLVYDNGNSQISIPFSFVADCWNNDLINKSRYNQEYQFIFDFNNDSIINAKDYAIFCKML
jgi:hypothetical protein